MCYLCIFTVHFLVDEFHDIQLLTSFVRLDFSFQNNTKNLDPSYKMDLDLWDCLGRVILVL